MTERSTALGSRLAQARERAGFTQEEVAILLGQPRTVISNWEHDTRRPNAHQLGQLAAVYRVRIGQLVGTVEPAARPDFEQLVFRDAGDRLGTGGKYEIQRFLGFLDGYADLLNMMEESPGLSQSPLHLHEGFESKQDVRRKAREARRLLGLGGGPIRDLDGLVDLAGITVYGAGLGPDLMHTVSGAFLPHDRVGFAILVNIQTTPGHRRFTLAHELGHALFHGNKPYVGYSGRRETEERFCDAFAAEFLVPAEALRGAAEAIGVRRVRDAETTVHLQQLFGVSYAMMLVRLNRTGLLTDADQDRLRSARPVHVAERLGYAVQPDERIQDPDKWGLARYPRRFLRLLRQALSEELISIGRAASLTGLAGEDIEEFTTDISPGDDQEFDYFSAAS